MHHRTHRAGAARRTGLLLAVGALLFVACGESNKVGDDSLLNFRDQAQQRLGQATPTPAAAAEAPPTPAAENKQVVAAATPTPKTVSEEQIAITININSDNSGTTSFDPSVARVFVNSQVRWVNKDSIPRSVESDTNAFMSGMIKPGDVWVHQFKAAGKFNYHDGTRPYAVAAVEVLPK